MRAGKLRHIITIQRPTDTRNDYGEVVEGWEDVITTRASAEPLQGREYFASQQVRSETTTRFRIRWPGMPITPDMRVMFEGRAYDIDSVIDPNERHRELHVMAVEKK
jgi:SPP1 family predicted phage head-tail adaptor